MDIFPLNIFPGSLAHSVITTVWIGVFFSCFFNLRFGWVFSGLVVSGYLAPLLVVKPWVVVAIIVESLVTYLLAYFTSEKLSAKGFWCSFFGRDRFFLIVLYSVVVRVLFGVFVFPDLSVFLQENFQLNIDFSDNLYTVGLIIISLTANAMWKLGWVKSVIPLSTQIGLTFLVIKFILMPYTNFSIANLSFAYEDVVTYIDSSPKSYMILLAVAFFSSRFNLKYGWEYNGILIPALLALQWHQPHKILSSFVECAIIYILADKFLKLPIFKKTNIEGARKLLVFFNISYVYKYVFAFICMYFAFDVKVTDFYGFGYLLPTLMAIKMHDKKIIERITVCTMSTAFVVAMTTMVIGYSFTVFNKWIFPSIGDSKKFITNYQQEVSTDFRKFMTQVKVFLYNEHFVTTREDSPVLAEDFSIGLEYIYNSSQNLNSDTFARGKEIFDKLGYRIYKNSKYLIVAPSDESVNYGVYVINTQAKVSLMIEIPKPLHGEGVYESAVYLFEKTQAKFLSISRPNLVTDTTTSRLRQDYILSRIHYFMSEKNVLQLHEDTTLIQSQLVKINNVVNKSTSSLWMRTKMPEGIDSDLLSNLFGDIQFVWNLPKVKERLRIDVSKGFAEFYLKKSNIEKFLTHYYNLEQSKAKELKFNDISSYLQDEYVTKRKFAGIRTNLYQQPSPAELRYLDQEVLSHITQFLQTGTNEFNNYWLKIANARAKTVNMEIVKLTTKTGEYLVFRDQHIKENHYWGQYVFRLDNYNDYVFLSPRAMYEKLTLEFSSFLEQSVRPRALFFPGAHALANNNKKSDVLLAENKQTVFNLVYQSFLRRSISSYIPVQFRTFSYTPGIDNPVSDILVAFQSGRIQKKAMGDYQENLFSSLNQLGFKYDVVQGERLTAGYEVGPSAQARYTKQSEVEDFIVLWLSPRFDTVFNGGENLILLKKMLTNLEITQTNQTLQSFLSGREMSSEGIPLFMKKAVEDYLQSKDIVALAKIFREWGEYKYEFIEDTESLQSHLIIAKDNKVVAAINMLSSFMESENIEKKELPQFRTPASYIKGRKGWLIRGDN